jgi:very-short-patch-repair endonuclease
VNEIDDPRPARKLGRVTSRAEWREQVPIARQLRREPTTAEQRLWALLRNRGTGVKFRRQHPVGRFILDFYCVEHGLAIEIDGPVHESQQEADRLRTNYLEQRGIHVMRFSNDELSESPEMVRVRIGGWIRDHEICP